MVHTLPRMVELVGIVVGIISVSGTALYYFYNLKEDIMGEIQKNDKKIEVIGAGVLAIMKKDDKLKHNRFEEAMETNGFEADDFIESQEVMVEVGNND